MLIPFTLLSGLLSSAAQAATYYLAPHGKDSQAGASASPWKTFAYAIPKLKPGDTLLVKAGTYTSATSGYLHIYCGTNATNGTPQQPITVKAEQERQAFLRGDGSSRPVHLRNCAYWTLEGLRAENGDFSGESGDEAGAIVVIKNSHHLTIRRFLLRFNNRRNNAAALFASTDHSLFEENELYSYHRHGLQLYNAHGNTVRRNYANSRGHRDLAGGYASANDQVGRGDSGFILYGGRTSTANIFENNLSEGNASGYGLQARYSLYEHNRYYGNISLRDSWGMKTQGGPSSNNMAKQTTVVNFAVIQPEGIGLWLGSVHGFSCTQCTVLGAGDTGILVTPTSGAPGSGIFSFDGTNILVASGDRTGVSIGSAIQTWHIDALNAYGNHPNVSPARSAQYSHLLSIDPKLGGCTVWIPDSSSMKHAGKGGADIGANILYRYKGGSLTNQPLWDPATGGFPCGAAIAGVNDIPGSSCVNVHQRLNVNTKGCSFPSGYKQSFQSSPTNLRILSIQ
jgi:hypothetical protein